MKGSILKSMAESTGLVALVVILFTHLQPLGKAIVLVCLGYWILKYTLYFFWGLNLLASMLAKACYRIFEYHIAWILKL